MEELRLKKLELKLHEHNRRLDDHENMHLNAEKRMIADRVDIDMLKNIAKSNQEILEAVHDLTDYAKKTYEVFEPLAKYGAKVVKIGAFFIAVWHGVKWLVAKIAVVWP